MVDYSKLTIVLASPAQARAAVDNHYPFWGQPRGFDTASYHAREGVLQDPNQPWAANNGFVTWALVPRDDPTTTDLLAACETYRRGALVLAPGSDTPTETYSYGIASVFCPPEQRNNGYPRHLLSLLHYVLAPEDALPPFPEAWGAAPVVPEGYQNAAFSTLWSDVGPTYYSKAAQGAGESMRLGWVADTREKRIWTLPASSDADRVSEDGWEWLDEDAAFALQDEAAKRMKRDIVTKGDASKTRLAILPSAGIFKIPAVRYKMSTTGRKTGDVTFGLSLPAAAGGERPFVVYHCAPPNKGETAERLEIRHISGDVPFAALVAAARHEGAGSIEAWDVGDKWDGEMGGPRKFNDEHISAIAVYGAKPEDVEWVWCEKYPWV